MAAEHGQTEDGKTPSKLAKTPDMKTLQRAMVTAIKEGSFQTVKSLLSDTTVDVKDEDGFTPLMWAAVCGNVRIVELLLQHKANIHATASGGWTAFLFAAKEGQADTAMLLYDMDPDVFKAGPEHMNALHWAAMNGHVDLAQKLLECRAQDPAPRWGVDEKSKDGSTPLHYASRSGDLELVDLLLRYGADATLLNRDGCSSLKLAQTARPRHPEVIQLLTDAEAQARAKGGPRPSMLKRFSHHLGWSSTSDPKDERMDTKPRDSYMRSQPLGGNKLHSMGAIEQSQELWREAAVGNVRRVEQLMADKAHVNDCDADGYTALHRAAQQGFSQVVELLLDNGADANMLTMAGFTAFELAARGSHSAIMLLMFRRTPAVNTICKDGATALHIAAKHGFDDMSRQLLLNTLVAVDYKDKNGESPLHWAAEAGTLTVAQQLLAAHATVNNRNQAGSTPLHKAVEHGHVDMARLLIAEGADVKALDQKGRPPFLMTSSMLMRLKLNKAAAATSNQVHQVHSRGLAAY